MSAGRVGRVDNGKPADYDFNIGDAFREAWEKTKGFKKTFWGAFNIYFFISLVLLGICSLIEYFVKSAIGETAPSINLIKSILGLVRDFIEYPMVVGLLMIGIYRSVNLPVHASMVLSYYKYIWRIIGVVFVMMLLILIPSFSGAVMLMMSSNFQMIPSAILMVIGGLLLALSIYLLIGYLFAVVLTVEKHYGIWMSLRVSRRAITKHWFKVFFTTLALVVVFIIAAIPLLIGLIWALPLGYCVWGILYRTMFGVEEARNRVQTVQL